MTEISSWQPGAFYQRALERTEREDLSYEERLWGPVAGAAYALDVCEFRSRESSPQTLQEELDRSLRALALASQVPDRARRAVALLAEREHLDPALRQRLEQQLEAWGGPLPVETREPVPADSAYDEGLRSITRLRREDPLPPEVALRPDLWFTETLNRVESSLLESGVADRDALQALQTLLGRCDPFVVRDHVPRVLDLAAVVVSHGGTPAPQPLLQLYGACFDKVPELLTVEVFQDRLLPLMLESAGSRLSYSVTDRLKSDRELLFGAARAVLDHPERERAVPLLADVMQAAAREGLPLGDGDRELLVAGLLGGHKNKYLEILAELPELGPDRLAGFTVGNKRLTEHLFAEACKSGEKLDKHWRSPEGERLLRLCFPDEALAEQLFDQAGHLEGAGLWKAEAEPLKALTTLAALQEHDLLAPEHSRRLEELARPWAFGNESPSEAETGLAFVRQRMVRRELEQRLAEEEPLEVFIDMHTRFVDGHYRPQTEYLVTLYERSLSNCSELTGHSRALGLETELARELESGGPLSPRGLACLRLLAAHPQEERAPRLALELSNPRRQDSQKFQAARSAWREACMTHLRGLPRLALEEGAALAEWHNAYGVGLEWAARLRGLPSAEDPVGDAVALLEPMLGPVQSGVIPEARLRDLVVRTLKGRGAFEELAARVTETLQSKALEELDATEKAEVWALAACPDRKLTDPVVERLEPHLLRWGGFEPWRELALEGGGEPEPLAQKVVALARSSQSPGELLERFGPQVRGELPLHVLGTCQRELEGAHGLRELSPEQLGTLWWALESAPAEKLGGLCLALVEKLPEPGQWWFEGRLADYLRDVAVRRLSEWQPETPADRLEWAWLAHRYGAPLELGGLEPELAGWFDELPLELPSKVDVALGVLRASSGETALERAALFGEVWSHFGQPQDVTEPLEAFRQVDGALARGVPREEALRAALQCALLVEPDEFGELRLEEDLVSVAGFEVERRSL